MKNYRLLSGTLAAAMVASMAIVPALAADYKDTEGHWAQSAIDRWSDYGVVQGSNGEFRPDNDITRAEFAQATANLLNLPEGSTTIQFGDVADSDWFASAIRRCAAAGILQGDGKNANPNAKITREEAMVMLGRALGVAEQNSTLNFKDENQVSSWAQGFVGAMTEKGYVHGVSEDTLAPKANMTRAALMTILNNAIKTYANTANTGVTASQEGITLVVAQGVTVDGKAADLVVAGGAAGGTTTLKSNAQVADTLSVTAPETTVVLQAQTSTKNVAVTKTATDSKIVVQQNATVGSVNVAASKTEVTAEKGAKVSDVTVEDGADNSKINAAAGSTVDKVNVSADNTSITGTGVKSLTTSSDATGTTANGKDVASGTTTTPSSTTTTGGGSSSGGSSSSYKFTDDVADGSAKLEANVTISADELTAALTKATTIDLNQYTLTITGDKTVVAAQDLTISNGNVAGTGVQYVTALFQAKAKLTLNNVELTSTGSGIQAVGGSTVTVTGGWIHATGTGVYCIATNAGEKGDAVAIKVESAALTTEAADSCAFMLNIAGTADLNDVEIDGQRQGVVVRAGTAILTNCDIQKPTYTGTEPNPWTSGNEVATGSLVVGDTLNQYKPDADVTVSGGNIEGDIVQVSGATLSGVNATVTK